jgi:hypothetical protein
LSALLQVADEDEFSRGNQNPDHYVPRDLEIDVVVEKCVNVLCHDAPFSYFISRLVLLLLRRLDFPFRPFSNAIETLLVYGDPVEAAFLLRVFDYQMLLVRSREFLHLHLKGVSLLHIASSSEGIEGAQAAQKQYDYQYKKPTRIHGLSFQSG